MERKRKIFDLIYLAVFTAILLLSANLFFDIISLPDYSLSLMLVIGALLFVFDALIQKSTRNKT
jgi:hypothetical protein